MSPTVVEIAARTDGVSCALSGEMVVPRLVRRRGRRVEVALVAGRAMLLPGDEVRLRISVGAGCTLALTDIGGLVVYGRTGTGGDPSRWHATVTLGEGSRLTWDALPTVIADAGALERSLTIAVAEDAASLVRETLVLGRTGERGGRLAADTDIADAGGPVLRETLRASGHEPVPGALGRHRVLDAIIAVGEWAAPSERDHVSRLELEHGGAVWRFLGDEAHESPLGAAWLDLVRVPAGRMPEPDPASL